VCDSFFRLTAAFEDALKRTSPNKILVASLAVPAAVVATTMTMMPEQAHWIAHAGGVACGALVITRQAGFKEADSMKAINIIKSGAACVQYGLGGQITGVLINLNSMGLNWFFLKEAGKQFKYKMTVGVGTALATTALSAKPIMDAYLQGRQTSPLMAYSNAAVQSLPLVANYLGIVATWQKEGRYHRASMGGAGGTSIIYDVATGSYGMLVSSVGSFLGTFVGWYKHDRYVTRERLEEPRP
jgi:hypothetical protein